MTYTFGQASTNKVGAVGGEQPEAQTPRYTFGQASGSIKQAPMVEEKSLGRKTAEVLAPSTTNLSDYVRASARLKSGEIANIQKEKEAVQAGITQMEQMLPSRPDLAQSIVESKQRIAEIDKDILGVVSKADKTTGQKAGMAFGTGLELGSLPELAALGLGKTFGKASTKKVLEIAPKNKVVQAITKATTVAPKTAQQDLAYKMAPLSGKAKTIAKETAKVLPETLTFGYGYDVSTGLQDKAEQPFAPGSGTVMGASIPVAIGAGRLVKNAMFKPAEKKIADIITRREKELYNIENNYSLLRKNMNFSKDANAASRRRIASTDILANAVDDTGTIRTTNPGGPVDQYRDQVLHGSEAIVRKNLEREGAYTTPDVIRKKIEKVIGDSRLTMDEKETAFSGIDKILTGFQRQYPDGKIPLVAIQDEKVNAGALAYRNLDPAIKTRLKDLTRAYKEVLEESSNLNVKEMNDELAKYLKDISLLESLDGRKVKGGKLGKYFAQISGNLIGGTTGSAIGGVPGAAIGTVIGGELASRIKGTALSRTLAGETGQVGVKSPVLKEAQQKATSPRLQLPAPKFGRDYVQSNKSGNLNQRYADTAITSNSGNINNSLPLTADNANIQDMKLAEDFLNSQPNATIEADQIKAKELLSGLSAQLEALDSMDSMGALGKFVSKSGEFKGELNLNNGKGKFGKAGDTILREAVPGSDGKTSEELASKYSSWSSARQSIKENIDSLKKFLRQSPRGMVDLNAEIFPKKKAPTNLVGEEAKNLVVLHNISPDGVVYAEKYGGLPVPSIAISRKEFPLENFGDITLIADKGLIDPSVKTNKVYNADVYSKRFPSLTTRITNIKALQDVIDETKDYFTKLDLPSWRNYNKADVSGIESDGKRALSNDFSVQRAFSAKSGLKKDATRYEVEDFTRSKEMKFKYEDFVDNLYEQMKPDEKIFKGFTYSGTRRYSPATLENFVKEMKGTVKDTEGFNYGVSSLRASQAKQYKTLESIKKDRNKIISNGEMEVVKENFDREFNDLLDKHNVQEVDQFMGNLKDYMKGSVTLSQLQNFPSTKGVNMQPFVAFAEKLKKAPTEYFEAKPQRSVGLNEFKVAVVPDTINEKAEKVLREKGLIVEKYSTKDPNSRKKLVEKLSDKGGLAFALGGGLAVVGASQAETAKAEGSAQTMPLLGNIPEDKQEEFMRPDESYLRKPASTYSVRKNLSVGEDELNELAAVLFGEVGNRPLSKKLTELRAITNVALNRAEKEGKTLKEVLQSPNQFQAYLGKQYSAYKSGKASNSILEKEKIKAVEAVIDEIRKGKFTNTVGDNLSYAHLKDDTLRLYKNWSEQKKDLNNIK